VQRPSPDAGPRWDSSQSRLCLEGPVTAVSLVRFLHCDHGRLYLGPVLCPVDGTEKPWRGGEKAVAPRAVDCECLLPPNPLLPRTRFLKRSPLASPARNRRRPHVPTGYLTSAGRIPRRAYPSTPASHALALRPCQLPRLWIRSKGGGPCQMRQRDELGKGGQPWTDFFRAI